MDHISDLALDFGPFALNNELNSGKTLPPRIRRVTKKRFQPRKSRVLQSGALCLSLNASEPIRATSFSTVGRTDTL
jgi:hypothetical protein